MTRKLLFLLTAGMCIATAGYGHSGKTDSRGGHNDRKNGTYHYHCGGNPAHGHKNGVCPYRKKAELMPVKKSDSTKAGRQVQASDKVPGNPKANPNS